MGNVILPKHGFHQVFASVPSRWELVTPDDTEYLRMAAAPNEEDYYAAFGLYSYDGGLVYYHDVESDLAGDSPKYIELLPGAVIPGTFVRIMESNTTATKIWAAYME